MKKILMFVAITIMVMCPEFLMAQGALKDYQRAEQLLHFNINKLTRNLSVNPIWIDNTSSFIYTSEPDCGQKKYLFWSDKTGKSRALFNQKQLAIELGKQDSTNVSADSLQLSQLRLNATHDTLTFKFKRKSYKYVPANNYLTTYELPTKTASNTSTAPNKKWTIEVKNHNLYLNKDGKTIQLTNDGVKGYDYATPSSWYRVTEVTDTSEAKIYADIRWSPNSKKFVTYKLDRRNAQMMYLYQSHPKKGMRAKVWEYERPLPGENSADMREYYIFDIEKGTQTKVNVEPFANICSSWSPIWIDNDQFYFTRFERGYQKLDLFVVNAHTGDARTAISESNSTMIETQLAFHHYIKEKQQIIWASERSGWNQLYLYDLKEGRLINRITNGAFVVREIKHVDVKKEQIWFQAGGKENDRDPYYRHLYKINLNGKGLKLLTPEDADHDTRISTDGKNFVDNYSRIDKLPISVVRSMKTGKIISKLQEGNIDRLLSKGYQFPKPFWTIARDDSTRLYGAIFFPSNFDPKKKYPVIDATYSGPQAVKTPKSFLRGYRNDAQPLAELGFIVVTIDGMGTAKRSKAFHDVSYKNLGDIGAPDHIGAIKQLAQRYDWIDTSRVGIYGHSAGGYDAAHAVLKHGNFYKVAVASAGNHDHAMAKAWWPEQYMGMPGEHYKKQSNLAIAQNLTGKLLLVHGDMDNNVNPASTLRLAAMLIKHNRDFDLLLIPNHNHNLYSNRYFIRKRWDYFVENLMGVEPPSQYKIQ